MKRIILLLTLCYSCPIFAQGNGDDLRNEGQLEAAMYAYGGEFMKDPSNTKVAYKLASTLALVNEIDTAFFFLNVALQNDNSLDALVDADLYSLITHPKWKFVEANQMKKYQEANGQFKDPKLTARLLNMILKDQALNYQIHQSRAFFQKNGHMPHWLYAIGMMKKQINEGNLKDFEEIITTQGWPTYSMVGELAADAMLLVVNHHEDDAFRKQYLPQIKEACLAGEGSCMEFAKIQDRILVNEGKEQLYGMQFRYNSERKLEPFPIQNPEKVDERRKAIGLEPLAVYLKRKINYDWSLN